MDNNDEIKLIITHKYKLTDKTLIKKIEEINEITGIETICVETEEGYIFKDERFRIPIGELRFNMETGQYNRFQLYSGAVDEVRSRIDQEHRELLAAKSAAEKAERARKRKFKLVRTALATGLSITIAGAAVLVSLGIIDSPFKSHDNDPEPNITASAETALNKYDTANDVILIEWLNYAMGQVQDMCNASEYESFKALSNEVYVNYFAPAMSAYYTYLDYKDSDLPLYPELGDTDLVANAHNSFRARADEFTSYLASSVYFKGISFADSPLANAIVTDQNGNVLAASSSIEGELVSGDGSTVNAVDGDAKVRVRLKDIENSPYTLTDLPEDAQIIAGEVYVESTHMYQNYVTKSK